MKKPLSTSAPRLVAWLGYGGLIPFVTLALAVYVVPEHHAFIGKALAAYGAVILSFVGALHWGFAMTLPDLSAREQYEAYVWSVVPALLAWPALLLESVAWGSLLLVLGFAANFWRDSHLIRVAELPDWFLPLRLRLTLVACLCLLALAMAHFI